MWPLYSLYREDVNGISEHAHKYCLFKGRLEHVEQILYVHCIRRYDPQIHQTMFFCVFGMCLVAFGKQMLYCLARTARII